LFEGHYYYTCYDLVGNFDFSYLLSFKEMKLVLEPLFIEPLVTDRVALPHYSVIGPWEGKISLGVGKERIYTPSYTTPFFLEDCKRYDEEFYELTEFTEFEEKSDTLYLDLSSMDYLVGIRVSTSPHLIYQSHIYIKFRSNLHRNNKSDVHFRVFVKGEWLENNVKGFSKNSFQKKHFLLCRNLYFSSFPKNAYGSLIYSYKCLTLNEARKFKKLHEFISMSVCDHQEQLETRMTNVLHEDMAWDDNF